MEYGIGVFGFVLGVAIGVIACCQLNISNTQVLRKQAIAAGVAEYRVADKETGATEFRFKPCGEKQ